VQEHGRALIRRKGAEGLQDVVHLPRIDAGSRFGKLRWSTLLALELSNRETEGRSIEPGEG
jgi:hypothetical protein